MEVVLSVDPAALLDGDQVLRDFLPGVFVRNVVKWISVWNSSSYHSIFDLPTGSCTKNGERREVPHSHILCVTRQGHMMEIDSSKNIIRTCNLGFKPKKHEKIDILKFLSSESKWYVAILHLTCCHVYLQKERCFEKDVLKTDGVTSIEVGDFWRIGSQQLKMCFSSGRATLHSATANQTNGSFRITDLNPCAFVVGNQKGTIQ